LTRDSDNESKNTSENFFFDLSHLILSFLSATA
jgi:hypothetical protein